MTNIVHPRPTDFAHEPLVHWTADGLFAAPWTGRPDTEEPADVEELSARLNQEPAHREDITLALGHLLAVRAHCRRAASALDHLTCRRHYADALKECESALFRLHSCEGADAAALTAWALGVHALIRAQTTLTQDPTEARALAAEALGRLTGPQTALAPGAGADALSALKLQQETVELEDRLLRLPAEVRVMTEAAEQAAESRLNALNLAVRALRRRYAQAFAWAVGWGVLNLLLMAAAPINALLLPAVPWSIPCIVALPILWWATWAVPFRDGLPFFGFVRRLRLEAIADLRAAAGDLEPPGDRLAAEIGPLLEEGAQAERRLRQFYLFRLPEQYETVWKARAIAEGALARLKGDWVADMIDAPAAPLREVMEETERIAALIGVRLAEP